MTTLIRPNRTILPLQIAVLLVALCLPAVARADVLFLPTRDGADRFQRSASEPGTLALLAYFETEARVTFCGPTSLATALNSLGLRDPTPEPLYPYHLVTQATIFTPENQTIKSYAAVEEDGLTLAELSQFAANLHVTTETVYALDVSADEMRSKLRAALRAADSRVLVNYSRIPLGQEGDGHISPLAAYDAQTDSFLVLDVARYKYPPAWISFDQLFAAMRRIDTSSGKSRGALIISKPTAVSTQ